MAYQTPKKDWAGRDVPRPDDYNRIEGNIEYLELNKETPAGAQSKADSAEVSANAYTDVHAADNVKHITSVERDAWNNKVPKGATWGDIKGVTT